MTQFLDGDIGRCLEQSHDRRPMGINPTDQPSSNDTLLAHYYAFKEIHEQKKLIVKNGKWSFGGDPITMPEIYEFSSSARAGSGKKVHQSLHDSPFRYRSTLDRRSTVGSVWMFRLKIAGAELIRDGLRPPFCWDETS
jgi:hypothetical protein